MLETLGCSGLKIYLQIGVCGVSGNSRRGALGVESLVEDRYVSRP